MIKRLIDILLSAALLIILSPLFLIILILIKRKSPGSVFYIAERIGWKEVPFKMYKFRTMIENADKIGGSSTPEDDKRITVIGGLLRRFKLDELPQLINVFKGEMSFIGPRPEVIEYIRMLSSLERQVILSVRPGITDWASIWNFTEGEILKGQDDPDKYYRENIRPIKTALQIKYILERTLVKDLLIIWLTFLRIFKND